MNQKYNVAFRNIDVHAHVNFAAYDADRDDVVKRALEGNTAFINVGTQLDTSRSAIELANKYSHGVYAIIGLHPTHTGPSHHDKSELGDKGIEFATHGERFDIEQYRNLVRDPKVVGIGECGLDYYGAEESSKPKQKETFIEQIDLANESNKPLMLHIRDAYDDALDILKQHAKVKGNSHFFAGNVAQAQKFLDLGFTISFSGVITFARQYEELVKYVPLDMMHAETDSPYATPAPNRGKRNEPSYVGHVVRKIAELKKMDHEAVSRQLIKNAEKFFSIDLGQNLL